MCVLNSGAAERLLTVRLAEMENSESRAQWCGCGGGGLRVLNSGAAERL